MKGLLAVARREIAQQKAVFFAAAVATLLPFAAAIARRGSNPAAEVRLIVALFLAGAFSVGIALTLGGSTLARGLANGQLAFDFSRPLSTSAIWGGKLLGTLALAAISGIVILLPSALLDLGFWTRPFTLARLGLWIGALAAIVAVSHALGIALRSRSTLLAADVIAAGAAALIVTTAARLLLRSFAREALTRGLIAFGAAALIGFAVAGFAAVARGRTNVQLAHRALSRALWSVVGAATIGFAAYAAWVVSPTVSSLSEVRMAQLSPAGSWLEIDGTSRGRGSDYYPSFLVNASTGRGIFAGNAWGWWRSYAFSSDGKRVAWTTRSSVPFTGYGLSVVDLTKKDARPVPSKIEFESPPVCLALSAHASRAAALQAEVRRFDRVVQPSTITVFDLASGRMLFSQRLAFRRGWLTFLSDDHIRAFTIEPEPGEQTVTLAVSDIDLASKATRPLARIPGLKDLLFLTASPRADRVIVQQTHPRTITLYDAEGKLLSLLSAEFGQTLSRRAVFLDDGRIALTETTQSGARLRLFSPDGVEQKQIDLGSALIAGIGREAAREKLVVWTREDPKRSWKHSTSLLVDLASGGIHSLGRDLYPVAAHGWWNNGDLSQQPQPGSEATRLFFDGRGALVEVDPLTSQRRTILGGER